MRIRYSFLVSALIAIFLSIATTSFAQGDTCTTALQVVTGVHFADGPTTGDPGPSCGGGTNGDWYLYTPNFSGMITITSCHPLNNSLSYDTYLKVFTGTCGALTCIGFNDDMGASGQGCPNNSFASYMQVSVTAGQNYYIVWTNTFANIAFHWELNECVGTVTGATYFDNNNNGARDPGEAHAPVMLLVQPGNHNVYSGNDPYSYCTDMGAHTITVPTPPLYHNTAPGSQAYTINAQGDQITGMDFGFQGIPGIYDGSVDIWGWNPWIGNNTSVHLQYANIGTEPMTATMLLTLDPLVSFVSATVAPTDVTGQIVTWSLGIIAPGSSSSIHVTIHTSETAAPNAPIQSNVVLQMAETDINLPNNSDQLNGHATTSFDPNDKVVNEEVISPQDVVDQKKLEYTVRFQNTGNAPAVNVVIKDSLDADWDLSTFEMISASHPYTLTLNNGTAIWTFANIMLPDSTTDALGSQGGLHYRMAPKSTLVLGDQLTNRADIYFDYNEAVLTNTTVTTVALSTSITEAIASNGLLMFPSPGNGMITVRWMNSELNNARYSVMDALGREALSGNIAQVAKGQGTVLDLSSLPDGTYILRLQGKGVDARSRVVVKH